MIHRTEKIKFIGGPRDGQYCEVPRCVKEWEVTVTRHDIKQPYIRYKYIRFNGFMYLDRLFYRRVNMSEINGESVHEYTRQGLDSKARYAITKRLMQDKFFIVSDNDLRQGTKRAFRDGYKYGFGACLILIAIVSGIIILI